MRARTFLIIVALTCTCNAAPGQVLFIGLPDQGPATGTGPGFKYLHFMAGLALGLSAAGLAMALPAGNVAMPDSLSLPLMALAASAVGGTAKEMLDATGFGDPLVTDAIVTMVGGLAAALVVGYAQDIYPATSAGRANAAAFLLSGAALVSIPVGIAFAGEVQRFIARLRAPRE